MWSRGRKKALRDILRRMEEDPEGFLQEVREHLDEAEREAKGIDYEKAAQSAEKALQDMLREIAEKPEVGVRAIGIVGRVIFEKLERRRRTK